MDQECAPKDCLCIGFPAPVDRRWRKAFAAFAAILLILNTIGTITVYAENDTVRIGFFRSEKYGAEGTDGDLRGYDIHLSKTIGMFGGFNAEMVGYDSVADMEDALRSGEVDALFDFVRTEKRMEEFIFTNNPVMEEQVSLYTNNTPDAPAAESIAEITGLRIGYVSDSGVRDCFMDNCTEAGVSPRLMDFKDDQDLHSAMESGQIDACLTGSAVPLGYRVILALPSLSSYIMLRAEDTALRSRIDSAISQLKTDDPDYFLSLYHKYVASQNTEMSPLTVQEREYLEEHPVISVAVVRNVEPFTVVKDDGSCDGVIPDYYQALGDKLGVTFRFVVYDTTQDAIDAVSGGEADVLGHYYGDIIIAERDGLYDTLEYGSTDCARLTRSGFSGEVKTIAVTSRTAYLLEEQMGPDVHLEKYPNVEACYKALMHNEVDALIGTMTGISWLVNQHTMRGVTLSILPNVTLGIRGAVSCNNSRLLFVLNKAIAVSASDMNEAIIENAINGKTSLRTVLGNLPLGFSITVVVILMLLVIMLIVTLILLIRSSKERMDSLNREIGLDGLTGAGSRRYGTDRLKQELLLFRRYNDGPMLAMMDIDYFKRKNDNFGHEYGDFVLKKVVQVLRDTIRQSDMIVRWGGDEFILLFPRVHGQGAELILEKIVHAINSSEFIQDGKGEQITISVGAAFFKQEDEDIAAILRRCDSALYKAKSIRNTYHIFSDEEDSEEVAKS